MTDLAPILCQLLSNDNKIRDNAERILEQAKEENLILYFTSLVIILANESTHKNSRQMAGILLKNELSVKDEKVQNELTQKWLKLDNNLRNKIKNKVGNVLRSNSYEVRKVASIVLAKIISIDLYNNMSINFMKMLKDNITGSNNKNLIESSLMLIGYLCEDCRADALYSQSNIIFESIIHSINNNKEHTIVLVAMEALLSSMEFAKNIFQNENHRDVILKCIFVSLNHSNKLIRKTALECLIEVIYLYYSLMKKYMKAIFIHTSKIACKDVEQNAMLSVEVWSSIAELEIITQNNSGMCYLKKELKPICNILTKLLFKQKQDLENTTNLAYSASICLSLISKVVGDDIIGYITIFISNNITSDVWNRQEGSILALSAILGCSNSIDINKLIVNVMPFLLNNKLSSINIVKDTSIYCIGKICKFHPRLIINKFLNPVIKILINSMNDNCFISEKACWSLLNIIQNIENNNDNQRNELSDHFVNICQNLLKVISRKDIERSNLLINSYECLNRLISISTPNNDDFLKNTVIEFIFIKLENEIKNGDEMIQGLLCSILRAITKKLKGKINKYSDRLMTTYVNLLSNNNIVTFRDEVIFAISALAESIGSKFIRYMNVFYKFLLNGLQNVEDDDVCVASIFAVGDIAMALKKEFLKYSDKIMEILIKIITLQNIYKETKPLIISCFGDIAMSLGNGIKRYSKSILNLLSEAIKVKFDPNDTEVVEYVGVLRENLLECFIDILQGTKKEDINIFKPFVNPLMQLIFSICNDKNSTFECISKSCYVIGDLANIYGKQIKGMLMKDFINNLIRNCSKSNNKDCQDAAEWTISQLKKM